MLDPITARDHPRPSELDWWFWVASSFFGGIICTAGLTAFDSIAMRQAWSRDTLTYMVLQGMLIALIGALAQVPVLFRLVYSAEWWLLLTMISGTIAYLLFRHLSGGWAWVIAGSVVSVSQFWFLRRQLSHAFLWSVLGVVVTMAGMLMGILLLLAWAVGQSCIGPECGSS